MKKHQPGLSLIQMFEGRYGARDGAKFKEARDNFAKSLGAYSIVMWLLLLRDRHNGNLMLTRAGHYFRIDFGFILGHSTGGGIGGMVESSPWKLTAEYVEVLGGVGSPGWELYCTSCVKAMQAAHEHGEAICTLVEITGARSHFPCFEHMPVERSFQAARAPLPPPQGRPGRGRDAPRDRGGARAQGDALLRLLPEQAAGVRDLMRAGSAECAGMCCGGLSDITNKIF